ncbi:hypothetical protein ANN_10828 [Periplaneta americana]|uniref:Tc1-like transposase DDE domain-containing protein n=1 Tax=Periplaneta americana TaxID=6978 RepID=A0ABQ8T3C1_PERAM|nr:hypothetical protein ANN_10828 [Periplaneta americana]
MVRIRRLPGEQPIDTCTVGRRQAGCSSIMLWGTFTLASMNPVVIVQGTMKATVYRTLVAEHVHPFMTAMFPKGSGIFQQDNGPCHKARSVMEWFEEHSGELQLMCWAPNSPDLNPIEHIWVVIERDIRVHRSPLRNLRELGDLCVQMWCQRPIKASLLPCQDASPLLSVPKVDIPAIKKVVIMFSRSCRCCGVNIGTCMGRRLQRSIFRRVRCTVFRHTCTLPSIKV